jgi:hypothetical protein
VLEVRAEGSAESRSVAPEGARYFHKCGALQEAVELGYQCKTRDYLSPTLLHATFPVDPTVVYEYRVVKGKEPVSTWRRFRAPPAPGASKLRLAVVGDLGQTAQSAKTCNTLRKLNSEAPVDVAVLVGDLSYADGNGTGWDTFQRLFEEEGCADVPWLVMPGNHDLEPDDLSREAFLPLRARWRTPQVEPAVVREFPQPTAKETTDYDFDLTYNYGASFYSADIGPEHFLMLDPYTKSGPRSPQIAWLEQDLAALNRTSTPHLLGFTHGPFFHSSDRHLPTMEVATKVLKENALPKLEAAQMLAMFSGHVHTYQRTQPVHGATYIIAGHGGNREGLVDSWRSDRSSVHLNAHKDGKHYGLGLMAVDGGKATWYAYDNEQQLRDEAELTQPRAPVSQLERAAVRAASHFEPKRHFRRFHLRAGP